MSHLIDISETGPTIGCQKCGACCKWLGITCGPLTANAAEFYLSRGCRILKFELDDGTKIDEATRIYMPYVCPHLQSDNSCRVYEDRPEVCRRGRGYEEPITEDVCKWVRLTS